MSCFRKITVKISNPVKCLRSTSKFWRKMSGRRSAIYSLNNAFPKDENLEKSTYKNRESVENFEKVCSKFRPGTEGEEQNNTNVDRAAAEISNNCQHENNKNDHRPRYFENSYDSIQIFETEKILVEVQLETDVFDMDSARSEDHKNSLNIQTKSGEQKTIFECKNKIDRKFPGEDKYGSSEEELSNKNQKNSIAPDDNNLKKFDVIKPSCDHLNRLSRDYDLIEYSSINLEDLISRGSNSSSENQIAVLKTSDQLNIANPIFESASLEYIISECADKADNEMMAGMENNRSDPEDGENPTQITAVGLNNISKLKCPEVKVAINNKTQEYDSIEYSSIRSEDWTSRVYDETISTKHVDLIETTVQGHFVDKNTSEPRENQLVYSEDIDSNEESEYFTCEEYTSEDSSSNSEEVKGKNLDFIPVESKEIIVEVHSELDHNNTQENGIEISDQISIIENENITNIKEDKDKSNERNIKLSNLNETGNITKEDQLANIFKLSNIHKNSPTNDELQYSYIHLGDLSETCVDTSFNTADSNDISIEMKSEVLDTYSESHPKTVEQHTIDNQISEKTPEEQKNKIIETNQTEFSSQCKTDGKTYKHKFSDVDQTNNEQGEQTDVVESSQDTPHCDRAVQSLPLDLENMKKNIDNTFGKMQIETDNLSNHVPNSIKISEVRKKLATVNIDNFDGITPLKIVVLPPNPCRYDKKRRLLSFKMPNAEAIFKQSSLKQLYDLMQSSHQNIKVRTTPPAELLISRFIINCFGPSSPRKEWCTILEVT